MADLGGPGGVLEEGFDRLLPSRTPCAGPGQDPPGPGAYGGSATRGGGGEGKGLKKKKFTRTPLPPKVGGRILSVRQEMLGVWHRKFGVGS